MHDYLTIRDRIVVNSKYAGRMLGIYQQILQGNYPQTDDSREQIELIITQCFSYEKGRKITS